MIIFGKKIKYVQENIPNNHIIVFPFEENAPAHQSYGNFEEYLKDVIEFAPDVIILGCTHFPLLAPLISSILPSGIELINPGLETAHYAKELLEKHDIKNSSDKVGKYRFFVSDDAEDFVKTASPFLGREIAGETEKTTVDFL